ncbi:hypothetical protein BH10PAT1_BH10PAT1_4850 [soil metagenome]
MTTNPLIIILFSVTLIWLSVLTFFYYKTIAHFKALVKGTSNENFEKILENIPGIKKDITLLQQQELKHIQKVGMIRFNPFNETGGDNSFTICLMDANSNGVLLTGLHTREKTRMYAKKIENGKSSSELSNEEKKVIAQTV